MTVRVGSLNGKNLNYLDHDANALAYSLINPGVIEGLNIADGKVQNGRAMIQVTRTNVTPNQRFLVHVEITAPEPVDTTGTKKIWLEVNQSYVNDGTLATQPNGNGIAAVMTGTNYPSSNYIPLASVENGVVKDERKNIQDKFRWMDIPDMRNVEMPKPINLRKQTHTNYEFRPINTWEVGEINIANASWGWAVIETINGWTDWIDYVRQVCHRVQPKNQIEIWVRGVDGENWGSWQKIFPFSATALDISWLTETTWPASNGFFLYEDTPGNNKKISRENLAKILNSTLSTSNINIQTDGSGNEWYTNSVYLPRWGLVTINFSPKNSTGGSGSGRIQFSGDNSNWSSRAGITWPWTGSAYGSYGTTILVPPWYVRGWFDSSNYIGYGKSFTVQVF